MLTVARVPDRIQHFSNITLLGALGFQILDSF